MKKRGRILREASNGPGLIASEGQQFEFQLEGLWTADTAPINNTVVDFEVDENNKIRTLSPVNESQLAKEQADKALQMAKEKGEIVLNEAIKRVGKPVLISSAVLIISAAASMVFWRLFPCSARLPSNSGKTLKPI